MNRTTKRSPARHLLRAAWIVCGLLFVLGCRTNESPPCGMTEAATPGEEGARCPLGGDDCASGFGCVDGTCGSCTESSQCPSLQACSGGTCGECSQSAPCAPGDDCVEGICLPPIRVWELEVDPGDWAELEERIYENVWFDCRLTVEGVEYPGCRVRLQGASSRYFPKKSIRIQFPEDADHPGFSRNINLRAEWGDKTFMRTFLGYQTFRRLSVMPTPLAGPLFMTLNGEDYGVMMQTERLGGSFMARNGRDRDVSLYEAESAPPPGGLMPMPGEAAYREYDDHLMYTKKGGDREDFSDLIRLIEDVLWQDYLDSPSRISTVLTRTEQEVQVHQQVQYHALEMLVQNRDHVQSNFHFSPQRDTDGRTRWEFYPWDLDTTFGCHRPAGADETLCDVMTYEVWPWSGVAPGDPNVAVGHPAEVWMNLLLHLTLNEPSCSLRFQYEMCELIGSDWWTSELGRVIDALEAQLAPWVARDDRDRNDDLDDFHDDVAVLRGFAERRAEHLRGEFGCL